MTERAFRLPEPPVRVGSARFGGRALETAAIDGDELARIVASLTAPEGDVASRADALERAARRFLDPADPLRRIAEEWLPPTTGFSPEMIRETLPLVFTPIMREALVSAVRGRAPAVRSVAIVAAGNVLGVAVPKTALALAAGVPCLVKTGSGEPLLSVLFARAIAEADEALGRSHAALWWDGARADLAAALGRSVDSLVAYGSDEAIAALRLVAPASFVGHGHRRSAAVVRLPAERPRDVAARAARDVALYDQQGCLSPQAIHLIGGDATTRVELFDAIADALGELEVRLPRGPVGDGEHVAIRRFRDDAEWRAIAGEAVRLRHDDDGTAWTVVLDSEPPRGCPLGRTIVVQPHDGVAAVAATLERDRGRLESIGVVPWPDAEIVGIARELGIPRVAPLGEMQAPDLGWRQGGRDPLAGIVAPDHSRTGA